MRPKARNGIGIGLLALGLAASSSPNRATAGSPIVPSVTARLPGACAQLSGRLVTGGTVDGAEPFRASEQVTGGTAVGALAAADFCRARLTLRPVAGSEIKVEVWLPERWNGKLMGFGGGGFDGSLNKDSGTFLNRAIAQGYAAVAGDAGHTPSPTPGAWVHKQPEKVIDFGHRGVHLTAVVAKEVLGDFYGRPARRAYFQGCSNGGRDALMLVTRYPQDYDAVIAGAPAIRYTEVVTQLVHNSRIARSAPGLEAKLGMVHGAILSKCDALDGVKDGILENPRLCSFNPAVLQCTDKDGPSCLSKPEVSALRELYSGTLLPGGQPMMAPLALGSEGIAGNWSAWVTGPVPRIAGEEFYRWMVHDDPSWSLARFDFASDYAVARQRTAPVINVENSDIAPFVRRGGKLIIYQGWGDPAITPGTTIAFYDAIRKRLGRSRTQDHVRLFMVPGMAHCGGGPGATSFDMQAELEKWDAGAEAPTRIEAARPDVPPGEPPFTRPLCAWPMTAHYKGRGSVRDSASFTCRL